MSVAILVPLCIAAYFLIGVATLRLVLPRFWAGSLRVWSEKYARESVLWKTSGWVLGWPIYAITHSVIHGFGRMIDHHNPYRRERELLEREARLRELERRNRKLERELGIRGMDDQ